jgi:predicted nucleic acid-binding protein
MAAIGRLTVALDDRILAEYREVLARTKLRLNQGAVSEILTLLQYSGIRVIAPPLDAVLPDPDDIPFLEVAAEAGAVLVTGNLRHFPPGQRAGVLVQTPADVVATLAQHRRSDVP